MSTNQFQLSSAKKLQGDGTHQSTTYATITRFLLFGGILSSLLYIAMNIFIARLYPGYDVMSQTISELSAIDATTRTVWVQWGFVYTLLLAGFGWGVLRSAHGNRSIRIVGWALIAYGIIGLGWPLAPMHQREVLAAGGGTISDTFHIVFSAVTVLLMLVAMGIAANQFGKGFKLFSIISIVLLVGLGIWMGMEGEKLNDNIATPWLGFVERILILIFLVWVGVVAGKLWRRGL